MYLTRWISPLRSWGCFKDLFPAWKHAGIFYAQNERGGDVPNEKNLVSLADRTTREQREIAQKGGIASGAARRRKRSMREAADYYLSLPETDRRRMNAMLRDQIDPEDVDNQMSVIVGIAEQAKRGNPQAASVLLKMLGEDTPQDDPAADALEAARELLGGVDSAID
nr:MAG TPA_asm: hypothetical protein [Caudoviricetes sp.]